MCLSLLECYKIILSRPGGRKFIDKVAREKIMDIVEYKMDSFYIKKESGAGKEFIERMAKGKNDEDSFLWKYVSYMNKKTFTKLDELIEATGVYPKTLDEEYVLKRIRSFTWKTKTLAKSTFDGLVSRGFALGAELPVIVDETKEPALKGLAEEISYESDSIEEESSDSDNE